VNGQRMSLHLATTARGEVHLVPQGGQAFRLTLNRTPLFVVVNRAVTIENLSGRRTTKKSLALGFSVDLPRGIENVSLPVKSSGRAFSVTWCHRSGHADEDYRAQFSFASKLPVAYVSLFECLELG